MAAETGFTNYLSEKFLNHILKGVIFSMPDIYVGCSYGTESHNSPTADSPGTEWSLARINHTDWSVIDGVAKNLGAIWFETVVGEEVGANDVIIFGTSTGDSEYLLYIALDQFYVFNINGVPTIQSRKLVIDISKTNCSTYFVNKVLEHLLGLSYFVPPTIYIGLLDYEQPSGSDEYAGHELGDDDSFTDYERVSFNDWSPPFDHMYSKNQSAIDFGYASTDWGTAKTCAAFDAPYPGGNILFWSYFIEPVPIYSGDPFQIPTSDFFIKFN